MVVAHDMEEPTIAKNIKTINDYCFAKNNIKGLQESIYQLQLDRELYDEYMWEKINNKLNYALEHQQSYIDEYIAQQPVMSAKFFGANVKYLLKKHDLRVADLETILGISTGYISRTLVDSSKKRLSIDVMWQISNIFSINIDTLINVNLSDIAHDIQPVIDFIDKLKKEPEDRKVRWKNRGKEYKLTLDILYTSTYDFSGNEVKEYGPYGYIEETNSLVLYEDIYTSEIMDDEIYFIPVQDTKSGRIGVDIYVYERYEEYGELNRICCTLDDKTENLNSKVNELMNVIKLHENDFVVSSSAKRFIDNYLNKDKNG